MSKPPDNFLHVYSQYMWHDDAVIRGTKTALLALRDAVDAAIEGAEGRVEVLATDGEGYHVVVSRVNTIAAVGQPEYRIDAEYTASERAARRRKDLSREAKGWEEAE